MRTNLDFTPFYRSSIGFDRLFNLLNDATRLGSTSEWPAYDIVRDGDDQYRIILAVPGFMLEDLEITQQPNLLLVTGKAAKQDEGEYLHRTIQAPSFSHRFELADYLEVTGAELYNGLLTIYLKRELPEAMKPRRIEIGGEAAEQLQIGSRKVA
jgi:molecular chaperone IbpA